MRNYDNIMYYVKKLNNGGLEYRDGKIFNVKFNRYVKGGLHGKGSYRGFHSSENGVVRRAFFHLVIFAYFHGIEELKKHETIDHINGNSFDNRIENLQGMTRLENTWKSLKNKLNIEDVYKIRKLLEEGKTCIEISKLFNVNRSAISDIKTGRTYKHVK